MLHECFLCDGRVPTTAAGRVLIGSLSLGRHIRRGDTFRGFTAGTLLEWESTWRIREDPQQLRIRSTREWESTW